MLTTLFNHNTISTFSFNSCKVKMPVFNPTNLFEWFFATFSPVSESAGKIFDGSVTKVAQTFDLVASATFRPESVRVLVSGLSKIERYSVPISFCLVPLTTLSSDSFPSFLVIKGEVSFSSIFSRPKFSFRELLIVRPLLPLVSAAVLQSWLVGSLKRKLLS